MRALLIDHLPSVADANKADAERPLNGVKVTDAALVQALLKYGSYDSYYYVRESSKNNKANDYQDACRLQALDLGSIESMRTKAPDDLLLFTSSHHPAKFVPFRQFCGHEEWPICGRTHGLTGNALLPTYSWNHVAALTGYDAIICTSNAGRQALHAIFDGLSKSRSVTGIHGYFMPRLPLMHIDGVELSDKPMKSVSERADQGFVVLSIGRLTASYKADLRPLIAAFMCSRTLPAYATLMLAGDDTSDGIAADLKRFADTFSSTRNLVVMPNIPAATKVALLGIADVALCMSDTYQETFGISVLEAMAAGLPVVAPNWDGYRDIVIHGKTGFLVDTSVYPDIGLLSAVTMLIAPDFALGQRVMLDIDELMHFLTLLSSNRVLANEMGQSGKRRAQSHFSWPAIVRRLEDLWDDQIMLGKSLRRVTAAGPIGFMDYDKVFAGHPQRLVPRDAVVTLRDNGDEFVERALSGDLFSPSPIAGFSEEVDRKILELCRSRNPLSIAELIEEVQTETSGPSMVTTQVTRMVKYGLLSLQPSQAENVTDKDQSHESDSDRTLRPVGV